MFLGHAPKIWSERDPGKRNTCVDARVVCFQEDRHSRFHTSDPDSNQIQSILWPALLEGENGHCLSKGIVVT